ncbi:MAG: hypothetical protein HY208_08650 [Nitrospirae bacterium]|nr:hypothetical protein [Nitrospirota bacterium]
MTMLKKIGYGVILWAIPYVTAIPLLPLMRSDLLFFKAIMVVEGLIVGAILAVLYFLKVQKDFLREGIVLGTTWMVVNWMLDYVALLPFTKMSLARYFMEIGVEYIGMTILTVAIGYVLQTKLQGQR